MARHRSRKIAARSGYGAFAPIGEGSADTAHSWTYRAAKRVVDFLLASALFVVTLPLALIAVALIKVESKGPAIFLQTRIGENGKPFRVMKFRSMYVDARQRFSTHDDSGRADLNFAFRLKDDPRVTRVGKVLRRHSLDELPSLWNVMLGEMSLVGPRPAPPELLTRYSAYRSEYLSVKPGMVCLSGITDKSLLSKLEALEVDLKYVRTRSLRTDFLILWRATTGLFVRRTVH